jgi:hypothetical protein
MACANHVFDVQVGFLADDEGRDWLITACKCGVRTATLMTASHVPGSTADAPAVIQSALMSVADDDVLHKYHSDAEQCLDKPK